MFQTLFIIPLYNVFIFLIGVMPGGDVGLAIIVLTLLVRAVFYPAFAASIQTQMGMQAAQADLDEINKKFKDNPDEKAKQTMAIFKERKIRPLASIVALLVQLPIFFALYVAFFRENLPAVNSAILYSFVHVPAMVHTVFLGFIDLLTPHNIILAAIVGILQYFVAHFSLARTPAPATSPEKAAAHKLQQRMMLFFLPAVMATVSYSLPAAVGIYFATGNLVSLAQEWIIRRHMDL